MLPRLVLNSWPQVILLPQPPKVLGFQEWATTPGTCILLYVNYILIEPDFLFLFTYRFRGRVSFCHPGWGAVARSGLTAASNSCPQGILPPQPPEYLGLWMHTTTPGQFLYFFVEMGFIVLPRLVWNSWSCDPPTLASQSDGITGMSHHAQP